MIPAVVRAAAQQDVRPFPSTVEAARQEIIEGELTGLSIFVASSFAQMDNQAGVGGRIVASWLASASVQHVPPDVRSHKYDQWLVAAISDPNASGFLTRIEGPVYPSVLADLDSTYRKAETQAHTEIVTLLETALSTASHRAGLQVMARIGDPAIKKQLSAKPLPDVPATAISLLGKESFTAVTGQQIASAIERAATDLQRGVRLTLQRFINTVIGNLEQALSTDLTPLRVNRGRSIEEAVNSATIRFRRLIDERIDPPTVVNETERPDPVPQSPINAAVRAGVATSILAMLTRSDLATGRVISVAANLLREAIPIVQLTDGLASVSPEVRDVIGMLLSGRARIVTTSVWRHGFFGGRPEDSFEPHRRLDGFVALSSEWERVSRLPFEYTLSDGQSRRVRPFGVGNAGRWFPGDHDGCTCAYETSTRLVLNIP